MKSKKLSIWVFLVTLMFLSTVSVVGLTQAINVREQLTNANENNNIGGKELLFNTIVEILNEETLKTFLKDKYKLTDSQLNRFTSYDYNDIENRYQNGLRLYKVLTEKQIGQLKEKMNRIKQINAKFFDEISDIIYKNEKVINDIDKLKSNNFCVECQNQDSSKSAWFPGQIVICTVLLILIFIFTPPAILGVILTGFVPLFMLLALTLVLPWLICMNLFAILSCQ